MSNSEEEVNKLYDISLKLDSATDLSKHEDLYKSILKFAKASNNAKKLTAQLIPRYFKNFPKVANQAVDALIDLCEEEDVQIRINAVRSFPQICKDNPSVLTKVADVLGQLLQTEVTIELDNVKHALESLFKSNPKGVLSVLFQQITNRDEFQREKALFFIKEKVNRDILYKDEEAKQFFLDNFHQLPSDPVFFEILMGMTNHPIQIVEMLHSISIEHLNPEKILSFVPNSIPLIQARKSKMSDKYLQFLTATYIPLFNKVTEQQKAGILRSISDISPYCKGEEARALLPSVFKLLLEYIPARDSPDFKLNISIMEIFLYIFHTLGAKAPGMLRSLCGIAIMTGQPSDFEALTEESLRVHKEMAGKLELLDNKIKYYESELKKVKEGMATTALKVTQNIREMTKAILQGKLIKINPSWQGEGKRKEIVQKKEIPKKAKKEVYVVPKKRF